MVQLARNPQVVKLAKDLGLNWRGDCLGAIRDHALAQVGVIKSESVLPIRSLDDLRFVVADRLRVKLEFVLEDSDIDRIATAYPRFHALLRQRLLVEFLHGDTEGITLEREEWDPRFFRYLAVVDARGERAARAYFTAWHELAHLLVHPEQIPFPGFRRTSPAGEREKDPLESVVDHVAGRAAFYEPLFAPEIQRATREHNGLGFAALESARNAAAPTASLYATAMGSLQVTESPRVFISASMALKANERRAKLSAQEAFDFARPVLQEKLRVAAAAYNDHAGQSPLAIRRNMRVPQGSVIHQAHVSNEDVTLGANEDQSWWETSADGPLPALPIRVEAARRGRYVYGMITPLRK